MAKKKKKRKRGNYQHRVATADQIYAITQQVIGNSYYCVGDAHAMHNKRMQEKASAR